MTIHHPDHNPYRHFTTRQRVDKAVQTLQGMIRGITIDGDRAPIEGATGNR